MSSILEVHYSKAASIVNITGYLQVQYIVIYFVVFRPAINCIVDGKNIIRYCLKPRFYNKNKKGIKRWCLPGTWRHFLVGREPPPSPFVDMSAKSWGFFLPSLSCPEKFYVSKIAVYSSLTWSLWISWLHYLPHWSGWRCPLWFLHWKFQVTPQIRLECFYICWYKI